MIDHQFSTKGQVGIGTLIVFIALVLVAAVAAGVLINTSNILRTQAQDTGEQSIDKVADRMQILGAIGEIGTADIDTDGDGNYEITGDDRVTNVKIRVKKVPGSKNIDLQEVTLTWVSDKGSITLLHPNSNSAPSGISAGEESNGKSVFAVNTIRDRDDSAPVLNNKGDRLEIIIPLKAGNNNVEDEVLIPMDTEDSAQIVISTASGANSVRILQTPKSYADIKGGAVVL